MKYNLNSMDGTIVNYRRGRHTQKTDEVIVYVNGVKELSSILGKKVVLHWKNGDINGKIISIHGKNGVRVRFKKGIPGQALGKRIIIV